MLATYGYSPDSSRLDNINAQTNYGYDNNGNITSKGDMALEYDMLNRLTRATSSGGSVTLGEYAYNGLNQRVKKTVTGVTTWFIYDFTGDMETGWKRGRATLST